MNFHRSQRRRGPRCLFLLLTLIIATASAVGAQTRLYIRGESVLLEGDVERGLLRVVPLPPGSLCAPVATADGHFVAWTRRSGFVTYPVLFDTVSGGLAEFPSIGISSSCPFSDPHAVRLLFLNPDADRILILEPGGIRQIEAPGLEGTAVAVSAAGELFYSRLQDIAVINVESGALLRTILRLPAATLAVTSDGRTLFVGRSLTADEAPLQGFAVLAHDAVTGAELARWTGSGFLMFLNRIVLDELHSRVIVVTTSGRTADSILYALETSSLTQVGQRGVGHFGGVVADPHADRSYALPYRTFPFGGPCFETWLQLLQTSDLADLGRVTVFGSPDNNTTSECALLGMGAPPTAPMGLIVSVANHRVTLTWSKPIFGLPTDHQLEVGSAPGLSNLLVARIGPATQFAGEAPSGVYYIRLRALNALGAGPASEELRVTVP
ncbi:MAG TPA: fibronectin type III domain-containing protein [Vicinamibacterales bacterium]|nr:fibronectin type III domain-containing protein [Vicinamibacterales bacterium]